MSSEIFRPFGPKILVGDLDLELIDRYRSLIEEVRGNKDTDAGHMLAGIIEEQHSIEELVTEDMVVPIFEKADELFTDVGLVQQPMHLAGLWMNVQKPLEINPPHAHTGVLSFVFYVETPVSKEEAQQNVYDQKRQEAPDFVKLGGKLNLMYGNMQFLNRNIHDFFPEVGKIIMFPSWLTHYVIPFYKEGVERVSVAGNIALPDKYLGDLL